MKKISFLLFSVLLTLSVSSQESSNFLGKWKFHDLEGRDLSDTLATRMLEKVMKTLSYHFREDGSYSSSFVGSGDIGTWEYNKKLNKLIIYSSKGEIQPFDVESYSEKELRLKDRKQHITIFKKTLITTDDSLVQEIVNIERTNATKEQLCKLWYLHKKESPEYSEAQQELANAITKGFIYRFDDDGTVYTKALSVENETQWEFGENKETVIIKGENFDVVWNIIAIAENELILSKGDLKEKWIFSTEER